MELKQIWAKTEPFQSVLTHGIISGIVAQVICQSMISEGTREQLSNLLGFETEVTYRFIGYLVSLHDIGKIEPHFQEQDAATKAILAEAGMGSRGVRDVKNPVRHELTGKYSVSHIWEDRDEDEDCADLLSQVIGAHHAGKRGEAAHPDSSWQTMQNDFEAEMREFFCVSEELPAYPEESEGILGALLLGITILSDWISSGRTFADAENWLYAPDGRAKAKLLAETFLHESGLSAMITAWGNTFRQVWPGISQPRCLQEETERLFTESRERILSLLIEAPMGEGKTEAGIFAAVRMAEQWGKQGFYVAMPTSATANQMVGRLRVFLRQHEPDSTVRLLHSMAWLVDEQTPEADENESEELRNMRRWLEPVRRGLLSQYAVGTVDQAMLSVSMAKHSVLRLLGLSGKVLLIDEIHSYDVYMGEFIDLLLRWCRALEVPVVMLSATIPPKLKTRLLSPYTKETMQNDYPGLTAITESGRLLQRRIPKTSRSQTAAVRLQPYLYQPEHIARKAAELVQDGGCVCVLMNTVKQAQAVYRALGEVGYTGKKLLFHARFPAIRRDEIEKQCLEWFGPDTVKRPERAILVATQVVEQSLDVDFDGMLSAAAPIDLLLQRIGRVWRHSETPRPASFAQAELYVLTPEEGYDWKQGDDAVYPPCLLNQSVFLLRERMEIRIPEDLPKLVADGYDESKAPESEGETWLEKAIGEAVTAAQAESALIRRPEKSYKPLDSDSVFTDEEGNGYLTVKTRLGEPTQRIALLEPELYAEVEKTIEIKDGRKRAVVRSKELARKVLEQSVSIKKSEISFLLSGQWDIEGAIMLANVWMFPSENGVFQSEKGNIRYDDELGVIVERSEL